MTGQAPGGWSCVLRRALAGGGVASLRYDPQGKSYAPDSHGPSGAGTAGVASRQAALLGGA